ncbi:MAG: 2Fe-2S iron-sulfur cluster-binding protein [Acidimicrobiia bacterium]
MSRVKTVVNGRQFEGEIEDNTLLLDFVRDELGLTGTKRSCEVQVCGACTVLVDGRPVSSCCFLAVDVDSSSIETIEGIVDTEFFERASAAFLSHAAVQCGFCTPGFVLTLKWIAESQPGISGESLRGQLRGNLCRCTGYKAILEAAGLTLGVS